LVGTVKSFMLCSFFDELTHLFFWGWFGFGNVLSSKDFFFPERIITFLILGKHICYFGTGMVGNVKLKLIFFSSTN
jgi:hypothetical protein